MWQSIVFIVLVAFVVAVDNSRAHATQLVCVHSKQKKNMIDSHSLPKQGVVTST